MEIFLLQLLQGISDSHAVDAQAQTQKPVNWASKLDPRIRSPYIFLGIYSLAHIGGRGDGINGINYL